MALVEETFSLDSRINGVKKLGFRTTDLAGLVCQLYSLYTENAAREKSINLPGPIRDLVLGEASALSTSLADSSREALCGRAEGLVALKPGALSFGD